MRTIALSTALFLATATAFRLPDFAPFFSALPVSLQDYIPQSLANDTAHELLKRQTTTLDSTACPTSFNSCSNLGAPALCCAANAVCSADYAGNVACCPSGAACSGTIGGVITSGTVNSDGVLLGGASATGSSGLVSATSGSTTTTNNGYYSTSTTTTGDGLVAASTGSSGLSTDSGGLATGTNGITDGSSTVASPAAGVRAAQVPFVAQMILRVLEYLPV
ncbi:hypothetical protein LTR85_005806 [Meristemomyces frigidus]|nr:hypothetical protein LTR85_005806 [Meristemomyces frigidus]